MKHTKRRGQILQAFKHASQWLFSLSVCLAHLFFVPNVSQTTNKALLLASPTPNPQTPAQTTQLLNDIESYYDALQTDPAYLSLAAEMATDSGAAQSLQVLQSSLQSDILNTITPGTEVYANLPTPFASFFASMYKAELSIMSKDGFGTQISKATAGSSAKSGMSATATATATGNAADPKQTSSAANEGRDQVGLMEVSVALAVGVLGVILML